MPADPARAAGQAVPAQRNARRVPALRWLPVPVEGPGPRAIRYLDRMLMAPRPTKGPLRADPGAHGGAYNGGSPKGPFLRGGSCPREVGPVNASLVPLPRNGRVVRLGRGGGRKPLLGPTGHTGKGTLPCQ